MSRLITLFSVLFFINYLSASSPDSIIIEKTAEWAKAIDQFWGQGIPTDQKLQIFDRMWNDIDQNYGAFLNLDVNIDSLRDLWRPEIAAGVSKGRFVAIMNYFALALRDLHTQLFNIPVNRSTPLKKGTPLFFAGSWRENKRFGAVLTPLPDSSLLVLRVAPFQGLHLDPGDIVLGYEGIPWKIWYREIMKAQLPLFWRITGSTDESFDHMMLQTAGLNWHLFDTIDILKYDSGDTLHLSTEALINGTSSIWGNEQIEIAGVPMPDFIREDYISWGIVEGTKIGYIYVSSWNNSRPELKIREQFADAVDQLMHHNESSGLIIDSRFNTGGSMSPALDGYELLFNTTNDDFGGFDLRGNPDDHFDMVPHPILTHDRFIIHGEPNTYYDKPIALLIGPNSVSAGDNESLRMTFHPMVRTFGLPTNGAFTLSDFPDLGNSEWFFQKATGSSFLQEDHKYFAHTGVIPDERIWFNKDDAANGDDTVVKAAIQWMQDLVYAHSTTVNYIQDSVLIVTKINNPQNTEIKCQSIIRSSDSTILDTISLFDDGLHDNGIANDGIWGNRYKPKENIYTTYFMDIITGGFNQPAKNWILPNASRFTTKGPVKLKSISFSANDSVARPGDNFVLNIKLKNASPTVKIENVSARLSAIDSCISSFALNDRIYGDMAADAEVTRIFNMRINSNCTRQQKVKLILKIASNDYFYWEDSIFIYLEPTKIADLEKIPANFELYQNYPNPFNPQTRINYSIPKAGYVVLSVYDIHGQLIENLFNGHQKGGRYEFIFNNINLASGTYFYRLMFNGSVINIKKMVLIR